MRGRGRVRGEWRRAGGPSGGPSGGAERGGRAGGRRTLYENFIAPMASSVLMWSWSHTETVIVSSIVGHFTGTSSCWFHTGSRLPGMYDDTVGVSLPNWSWTYGSTPPRPKNCEKSSGVKPSPRITSRQIELEPWITHGASRMSSNCVMPYLGGKRRRWGQGGSGGGSSGKGGSPRT